MAKHTGAGWSTRSQNDRGRGPAPSAPLPGRPQLRGCEEDGNQSWGSLPGPGAGCVEKGYGDQGLRLFCSLRLVASLSSFSVPRVGCACSAWDWARGRIRWNTAFSVKGQTSGGSGAGGDFCGTARLPGFGILGPCWVMGPRFHPFLPAWKDGVMVWRGEGGRGEAGQLGSALGRGGRAP